MKLLYKILYIFFILKYITFARSDYSYSQKISDICSMACGYNPPDSSVDLLRCINNCETSFVNVLMRKEYNLEPYDKDDKIEVTVGKKKRTVKKRIKSLLRPGKKSLRS